MNNISKTQNEKTKIAQLAAQRELYISAKKLYGVQFYGSFLFPILFSILSFFRVDLSVYSALYGISFYLIDIYLIEPAIFKRKIKATKIQELFDCDVLEIKKSPLKIAEDITVEEVLTHYKAHSKSDGNIEKLKDWYPIITNEINIAISRIICQRSNNWWDSKLRIAYCNIVKFIGIFSFVIILILGVISKIDIEQLVLILSGLIPFLRFASKQYFDNKKANDRLNKLNDYINQIWNNILEKKYNIIELDEISRRIQDETYENRISNPLIPDFFYKIFRSKNEDLMTESAKIFVQQVLEKNANID